MYPIKIFVIAFAAFFCEYLTIRWFPTPEPYTLSNILAQFIINPIVFIAMTIMFLLVFLFSRTLSVTF
ncbi:hypothetical protein EJF36_11515 [Bacillus sp. HMF5848]|uniref:hypothetical protein n=1 Tax=Bacillus sp. HMF5848 TaxID=2495421 RepID=UPI000F78911D|nr:hypothetical protein [Bacillus sp. HMF5848]RSK27462.1 hypothetical protein EJF36_11515 [Bacillus sp. HMF5848]